MKLAKITKQNITTALFFSFLIYGVVLTILFHIFNMWIIDKKESEQFKLQVRLEAQNKERFLNLYLIHLTNSLKAVGYNPYFLSYVLNPNYIDFAEFLFLTIMLEHSDYMQLRFIDKNGIERLRYDRKTIGGIPFKVKKLQDKSKRYYFIKSSKLKDGEVFISKIDFNIENGELIYPIVPVFRLSMPIYIKNQFKGVLTINTFAKKIIEFFTNSPIFNTIIFDKDGYLIYANNNFFDKAYNPKKIENTLQINLKLPIAKEYLIKKKKIYIKPIKMGNQVINVAFILKPNSLISFKKEDYKIAFLTLLILFIFAFPLSYILSRPTLKMVNIITKQDIALKRLATKLEQKVEQKSLENAKKDRLIIHQSRLAELGEMIGNIAHQWRHPLTRLSLILQNIKAFSKKDVLTQQKLEEMIKVANEQIFFMSDTIDNFKDFYKPVSKEDFFSLDEAIKKVLTIVGYDLKHKNIDFSINIKEKITLFGDINQFSQVLLNLIINARDILVERKIKNPYIKIKAFIKENKINILILDNGGGIKKEYLNKIFLAYFSTKKHGTGIGLYMVLNIIESKFKGKVEVSNSSYGAIFKIILPIIKAI